jgi:putative RNA 2'-phosphotransferase
MTPKSQQSRSVKLSYLLRHKPEAAGLSIDKEGWVEIGELISKTDFTEPELKQIVADDEKSRYSFSADSMFIRANQGHSTPKVQLSFKQVLPPIQLFHGADIKVLDEIFKHGLMPMSRHHVHLSADFKTAEAVGARRKSGFTVLSIDAKAMVSDKIKFFISENGVYLVQHVPPKYIHRI